MKVLAVLFVALASGAAAMGGAMALDGSAHPTKVARVQHLTMRVMPGDRMIGPNLVVSPGRVVLTIVNSARHAHTFSVPALGVEHVLLPGSPAEPTTTNVAFRVGTIGAYTWFCRLPCKHSMRGSIYTMENPPRLHGAFWSEA